MEDLRINWMIILICILREYGGRVWIAFSWLRIRAVITLMVEGDVVSETFNCSFILSRLITGEDINVQ